MAAIVYSFGVRGSIGSLFSVANLTIIRRNASDTVRPIASSTAAASYLVYSSKRDRTTVRMIRTSKLSDIVTQTDSVSMLPLLAVTGNPPGMFSNAGQVDWYRRTSIQS